MATWKTPALFVLLAALLAAPAAATDAQPEKSDAAVVKVDAKASTSQPTEKPEEPKSIDEAVDAAQSVFADFKQEKWRAGIAGCITLLVFLWRRFASGFLLDKLPPKALPFVTAGVAFLAAIPVTLAADPWSWKDFIWQGLITGGQAMAFWSLLFKFVVGKTLKKDEKPA